MTQSKIGWRAYVNPSTLWASVFSVWNSEGTNNVTVKNAWNANGNAVDSKSGANGTIVSPNSTTGYTISSMTYSTGKLGTSSFTFNGSNFINLPSNTFSFTSDFTVGCWFYVPTNYVSNAYLLSAFDNTGSFPTYFGWWLSYDSTNKKIGFGIGDSTQGSYGNVSFSTANNTITPGQWNHVMVTRKNSNRSRIYINGVLSNSNTNTVNPRYSNGYSSIGSNYFAFSQPYWTAANAGLKIDAVQTWDGVELDQTAITELYNSGNGQEYPFTLSNALITTYKDVVGTKHGITPASTLTNGVPGPTFTTGKIGQAFNFDGVNDYIQLPDSSLLLTSGLSTPINYSISAWLYLPDVVNYQHIISSMDGSSTGYGYGWEMSIQNNLMLFIERYGLGGSDRNIITSTISNNNWFNVVVTREHQPSTVGVIKMYINGTLVSTVTPSVTNGIRYTQLPARTQIGCRRFETGTSIGAPNYFVANGTKIDALSVWTKELTSTEVTELYNAGAGKQYPN